MKLSWEFWKFENLLFIVEGYFLHVNFDYQFLSYLIFLTIFSIQTNIVKNLIGGIVLYETNCWHKAYDSNYQLAYGN